MKIKINKYFPGGTILKLILALLLFQIGTQLSLWSHVTTGSSLFYLTVPFALILIYWWGPIILIPLYINAVLSAGLWDLDYPYAYPLYAIPETLFIFLSWWFFAKLNKGKHWLPDIKNLTYFLLIGILIPLIIQSFLLRGIFWAFDQIEASNFWTLLISTTLGDFIIIYGLTIPVLYFFSYHIRRQGLSTATEAIPNNISYVWRLIKKHRNALELVVLALLVLLFSRTLSFVNYWYLYGVLSLYSAIRFGFGVSIIVNSYILLLTYIIPSAIDEQFKQDMILGNKMMNIQIGSGLLYVFSLVTGRVISDGRHYQRHIKQQNEELEHVNKELDRFVYSVSHDLSAPLKSIRGLVNICRVEEMSEQMKENIDHIEASTNKLEDFIAEILDFSRNDRKPLEYEKINLHMLCEEILDGLKFFENFKSVTVDLSGVNETIIYSDKMRVKIMLTNLLSNAIKYQVPEKNGKVCIRTTKHHENWKIEVEDNGEGIHPEIQERIFEMFYRGTQSSHGSGLGLYITKEVVDKLGGTIQVNSQLGLGTLFTVNIPASGG